MFSLVAVVVKSNSEKDNDDQRLLNMMPLGHHHGRHAGGNHQHAYRFMDTLDTNTPSTSTTATIDMAIPSAKPRGHKKKHHNKSINRKKTKHHEANKKFKDYDNISGEFNCSLFNGRGCDICQAHASCIFMRCADIGSSFCSHKKIRHALEMHMPGLENCRLVKKCKFCVCAMFRFNHTMK